MRCALTASERAFKESVRELAERVAAAPDTDGIPGGMAAESLFRELGARLSVLRPAGLSRVEEVVALEEVVRRCPGAAPGLVGCGLFGSSSPGLCRAAADLGAAQGLLARGLGDAPRPGDLSGSLLQGLADAFAGIEAARLKLYRAAILEDAGRGEPDETAGAERLARDLAREAGSLMERIVTGGNDETESALREGRRDRDRQRSAGPRRGSQGPRG